MLVERSLSEWQLYAVDGDATKAFIDNGLYDFFAEAITLPPSDKFWDNYMPPNGWNCRCTVVQVRKGKYPESDSDMAIEAGERATTHIGKDGSNKAKIFRFNPGKQQKIFPPKHPYLPKGCGDCKFKLSYNPNNEQCKACKIFNECWKNEARTENAITRKHYLHEMEQLLDEKVMVSAKERTINVGFTKYGNKHLYSDTFSRTKILLKDDLKNLDVILNGAVFKRTTEVSKPRKDNIKRFYYYQATLRGKIIYLNVAEEEFFDIDNKLRHFRYLYSVTDRIK